MHFDFGVNCPFKLSCGSCKIKLLHQLMLNCKQNMEHNSTNKQPLNHLMSPDLTFEHIQQPIIYVLLSMAVNGCKAALPASLCGAVKPDLLNLSVSFDFPQPDWA